NAQFCDDGRLLEFSTSDLKDIANGVGNEITYQTHNGVTLAPSEIFWLLAADLSWYQSSHTRFKPPHAKLSIGTPIGPTGASAEQKDTVTADASQFSRTTNDVVDYMVKEKRMPSIVWLGSKPVTPEAYLAALARIIEQLADGKEIPNAIDIKPAKLA